MKVPPQRAEQLGAFNFDALAQTLAASAALLDRDAGEVAQLVQEAVAIERQPGGMLDPRTPSTFRLNDLKTPLRTWIFFRRHKWAVYAVPLSILGLAFLVGRATKS
jgi:hypothetical protein